MSGLEVSCEALEEPGHGAKPIHPETPRPRPYAQSTTKTTPPHHHTAEPQSTNQDPNSTFLHNRTIFNHHTAAILHLLYKVATAGEGSIAAALFHCMTRCAQGGAVSGKGKARRLRLGEKRKEGATKTGRMRRAIDG
ncbi:hypothetical protein Droror1_Dr00023202 [Drosera rotundifolia]